MLFLSNLAYGLPHATSLAPYAKVIRGKSLLRQLVKVANKITSEALEEEDEPQDILDHAEHAIFALADERIRQGFEHIKHPAERVLEKAEAVEHRDWAKRWASWPTRVSSSTTHRRSRCSRCGPRRDAWLLNKSNST